MHTPVLLQQAITALEVQPGKKYIDCTVGEGGHLAELLNQGGVVLGIDWDDTQVAKNKAKFEGKNVTFAVGNYADVEQIAKDNGFDQVDGVLFDLGLSMIQLSEGERGFSYKQLDDPIDMRIGASLENSAQDVLNTYSEEELYNVFAKYSEDLDSEVIAQTVVNTRKLHPIETVGDFVKITKKALENCHQRHQHDLNRTLTRVFQALRIVVNDEFKNIKEGLQGAMNVLNPQGRVAIISFHSLEDRIIKQFIREHHLTEVQTIKGDRELAFERSAILRIIEK
jgi:16S rRNA (cytosine1402-N4)-methyltransferase